MAQLNTVIYSVMRDLVLAQHEANLYSSSLKHAYTKDGNLENYSLPTIALGEIELDIRYGVNAVDENVEQYEVNYTELRDRLNGMSTTISQTVIACFVEQLKGQNHTDPEAAELAKKFLDNTQLQKKFHDYLIKKLSRMLHSNISALLDEDGDFEIEYLKTVVTQAAKEVLMNSEILSALNKPDMLDTRNNVIENVKRILDDVLPKITKDINCKRVRSTPSMDVILNSTELAKLPEECMHSFKIRIKPDDINMLIADHEQNNI